MGCHGMIKAYKAVGPGWISGYCDYTYQLGWNVAPKKCVPYFKDVYKKLNSKGLNVFKERSRAEQGAGTIGTVLEVEIDPKDIVAETKDVYIVSRLWIGEQNDRQ